jgi:hypothetical protein
VPGTLADKQLTYLDPSCGAGSFLVAILRYFLAARADVSLPATVEFLSNQLYGCDVDEEAIAVAEFLLHLEVVAHFGPSANQVLPPLRHNTLVVDDFLLPSQPLWLAGADYIFGNPPFGLSREGRLGASYAAKLRRVYRHHNFGKINSYLLFLAKSYEVLKSNGTLCLITPNAWLGIDSAKTFRQMLLQTGSLSRIQSCGRTLFEDQGVETVIVTVKKEANINTVCLEEATNRLEPITSSHISRQVLLERPAATIPIQWRPALCPVFASMMANSIPLKSQNSPYSPQIALQEYKEGLGTPPQSREVVSSRAFHANAPKTPEHIPFLLGRDIGRYHIAWSGTYLRYGPWLSHPGDISRYQQPRVVIREVTNSRPFLIQACAIRNTFVYNKSVLHVHVDNEKLSAEDEWQYALALSAFLNSRIVSEFLWYHGKKVQRALFPKLLCSDLKSLPLPRNFVAAIPELSILASEYSSKSDQQVDFIVGQLYGLSTGQVHSLVTDYQSMS